MKMDGLFDDANAVPLAERVRPRALDEFAGQAPLVGPAACCAG